MEVKPVDLTYILEGHGWSSCHIFVGHEIHSFEPTHVFNNPLEELLNGFVSLLKGGKSACANWFDEPGSNTLVFEIDQARNDHVKVTINTFSDNEAKGEILEKVFFTCYLKDIVICLWHQIQKLKKQLERRKFSESRNADFPKHAVKEFEKAYAEKYS